ncbi:MAG: hypothetical protein KBC47_02195, partial [Candidatus Peribacteraceae bacterium]|nr:hypothetical protein [Candidatus Peribacteraceae bacterium]
MQAAAGIYKPINYQGKLSSTGGIAITNGQYNMRFKIFSDPTGGVALWTETWNGSSQRVTSTGGLFSIALGSITTMTGSVDFNSDSLYLQVEFDPGNDGTYEEVFIPRRRFASVPYAHNANTLDGLDSTQFIRSDQSYTSSGTITIRPRSAAKIGIDIIATGGSSATGALRLSTQGGPHILFGSGGLNYDTNLYRVSANTLKTDDALQVVGTLSGSRLVISGNANISGSLLVLNNITTRGTLSGSNLTVSRSASISGTLIVKTGITSKGSVSGSTIDGFGLGSCNAGTSKLLYNSTTDKFECGTISASSSSFGTGNVLTIGDARYVRKSGDTMTGILIVKQTISGSRLTISENANISGSLLVKNAVGIGTASPTAQLTISGSSPEIRMYDGSYARFARSASNNAFGIYNNAQISATPVVGVAFSSASSQYISSATDGTGVSAVTLSFWTKRSASASSKGIMQWANSLSSGSPFIYLRDSSGTLTWYVNGSYNLAGGTLADDVWTHIAITWDGATWRSYKNGVEVTTYSGGGSNKSNATTLYFGQGYDGYWSGSVDEIRAYNTNLSAPTILSHYNSGAGVYGTAGEANIMSGWHLDENTGVTAADFTTAGKDMTLANGASWTTGLVGAGAVAETSILTMTDGVESGELGIITLGGTLSRTQINGKLLVFKTASTEFMRLTSEGYLGIGTTAPKAKLDVVGTISGSRLSISGNANITGALLVKNNITTRGTLSGSNLTVSSSASISGTLIVKTGITSKGSVSGSTISGFNLGSCTGTYQKLLYNDATQKFQCGAISTTSTFGTGNVLTIGDARYVRTAGGTMTGALLVKANLSGSRLIVSGNANISGALLTIGNISTRGTLSGKFLTIQSSGTISGALLTKGNLTTKATLSGSRLIVSGHTNISGSLLVLRNITTRGTLSGSNLTVSRSASISGTLIVKTGITSKGSLSGSTIDGFGLGSCNGGTSKLLYNSTTDKFECGTISASSSSFGTGNVLTIGDARYVRKSGDTMTGTLVISPQSGLALNARGTVSGRVLQANIILTSSGLLMVTQKQIRGSGALVTDQQANSTGAYLNSRATSAPLLVLNTRLSNSAAAPHILFGYNGTFDVTLYRSAVSTLSLSGHLLPGLTNKFDLGSSAMRWRDLYLSGGTLRMGSASNETALHYNTSSSSFGIDVSNNGSDELTVLSTGYVGIGTKTPYDFGISSTTLQIQGTNVRG